MPPAGWWPEGVDPGQGIGTLERFARGGANRTSGPSLKVIASFPASLFGLSTGQALVLLFVLLPFAVAALVFLFVSWRSADQPRTVLTSDILAAGVPARAEVLAVRSLGTIVDVRPMVRFDLRVRADGRPDPFDLEVIQALPRAVLRQFRAGDTVEVRLTPDMSRGAVVWQHLAAG